MMFPVIIFLLVAFMLWYYRNSDGVHDYFEKEELTTSDPPTLDEINNKHTNSPTWGFLKGTFWDQPYTGEHWKGKKYKVD